MADNFGLKIGLEGEKEFKSALAQINQSFKVLGSEMKLVSSQFDKNDTSVKSLTARNTVLNKEIETQKQKVEVLRSALENAATSFGENDKRTQAWQIQLNNAEAALNDMEREVADNEKAIDELSSAEDSAEKDTEKLSDSIEESGKTADEAEGKFSKFKDVVGTVAKATAAAIAAIGTAAVAAGKALWDMANETAQVGDNIDKTSQKIGISAEAYQECDYVFQRCGADVNNLQTGMKKLSGVITDAASGSDSAAEKLAAVGLSIDDLNGKSQEQQLSIVIAALQNMESGAERTTAANDLLGKSAVDMAAVLNMTAEETQALIDEANEYGMVMSNDAVAASAAFEDSLTKLQGTVGGLKNNLIGQMLPSLSLIMDGLSDLVAGNDKAASEIEAGVSGLIDSISQMIPKAVSLITMVASAVLESAPTIISALAEGILSAIPTLLPVVVEIINKIVTSLLSLLPQVVSAAMQIITSVASGIATALPTLIPTIISVVMQIVKTLIDNLPMILNAALQLVTGLTEGILNAIPVLVAALPKIIESIVTFIVGAIPQIIQTGVKLLSSLVTNLPTIINTIVAVLPQIITSIVNALTSNIPLIISTGITLLTSLVKSLPKIISSVVSAIPQIISGLVTAISNSIPKIASAGLSLLKSLIQNLPSAISSIVSSIPKIITAIVNAVKNGIGSLASVGYNLLTGLWNGMSNALGWVVNKIRGMGSSIISAIKGVFGIHSPSTVFRDQVGKNLALGLGEGFEDTMKQVEKDMTDAVPSDFDFDADVGFHGNPTNPFSGSNTSSTIIDGIVFNVYGAQGQSETEIANSVMEILQAAIERKGAVFA